MSETPPSQRLTPDQRQRIEQEEARREAERAALLARQREQLQGADLDPYVARRMERELEAIREDQRRAQEEELAQSGGLAPQNPYLLLFLGALISIVVVVLLVTMGRQ